MKFFKNAWAWLKSLFHGQVIVTSDYLDEVVSKDMAERYVPKMEAIVERKSLNADCAVPKAEVVKTSAKMKPAPKAKTTKASTTGKAKTPAIKPKVAKPKAVKPVPPVGRVVKESVTPSKPRTKAKAK